MTSLSRPDKITLDAYGDDTLTTSQLVGRDMVSLGNVSGMYNRFTNRLSKPLLGAKSIQLLSANLINTPLQLNDLSQLMFFYYFNADITDLTSSPTNLRCVRLHPSNFVPRPENTTYVKNRYFNSVDELVAALNQAASTGGDDVVFNPLWEANVIQFSYNENTRKISIASLTANFVVPACVDDPNVQAQLSTSGATAIRMNAYPSGGSYGSAIPQPHSLDVIMNSRLGFTYGYNTRQLFYTIQVGKVSLIGACIPTGVPFNNTNPPQEADGFPILLGAQNVGVYCSISQGGGYDSAGNVNLLGNIPIETAPLSINNYTLSSVETPCLSTPTEVYEITIELRDEFGSPFAQPFNYNTQITLGIKYD